MSLSARNFPGAAGTDILTSARTLTFSQLTSWFCRFNITSSDATTRRMIYWLDGTNALAEISIVSGVLHFFVYTPGVWSTGTGEWGMTAPGLSTEHDLVVTYDAGLTTNAPVAYLDGSSVTITPVTAPTGVSTLTNAAQVSVGNRLGSSNRCFDGWLSTIALWRGVTLSAANATSLHNGASPCESPIPSPSFYAPLELGESPESELVMQNNLTVTGTTVVTGSTVLRNPRCAGLMWLT